MKEQTRKWPRSSAEADQALRAGTAAATAAFCTKLDAIQPHGGCKVNHS